MCNGEHRPTLPPRVVAAVASLDHESLLMERDPLLQLRVGSCRDRFGGHVDYVELSGDLDAFTAPQIREPLTCVTDLAGDLVIDARLVSFIDSAGLRLLEDMFDRRSASYDSVKLHDPSRVVRRLMRLIGVDTKLATCTPSQPGDAAVSHVRLHRSLVAPPKRGAVGRASGPLDSPPTTLTWRGL